MNTALPFRIGSPDKPATNLAELFANRARDCRRHEAANAGWKNIAAFWRGRAEAFEVCADNLNRHETPVSK